MNTHFHLAQINVANAKADKESEIMSGFVARLDEIHKVADQSAGFIWRLETEDGDDGSLSVFNDPMLLINMSVWEDIDFLRNFVYKSIHIELIQNRSNWFDKMPEMHQALWWVPIGHVPTLEEAKQKLESIRQDGPTENAFTFGKNFQAPE